MGVSISINEVQARFDENNLKYKILNLTDDFSIVVTQFGGRILGPFRGEKNRSLTWLNDNFISKSHFRKFLYSGNWNIGGERIWIAPEYQYYVKDISNPANTWFCPKEIDPGNYSLFQNKRNECLLSQEIEINAYNFAQGRKKLCINRIISPVLDPLRGISPYKSLMDGVAFAGYEQTISLSEEEQDAIMSETWNLIQLPSGGKIYIPVSPKAEFSWYFTPSDKGIHKTHSNCMELELTKGNKYKIGYKAVHITGRIGYLNTSTEGTPYLLIRNFFNNPSSSYLETPLELGELGGGHSVHIYNDDGNLGSFGELECSGQTIGGNTGRGSTTDQFVLWIYMGEFEKLHEIGKYLLGVDIRQLK